MRSQARSADDVPAEFFKDPIHFPDCASATDEDAICNCDAIERDLRDSFAAMTREGYK